MPATPNDFTVAVLGTHLGVRLPPAVVDAARRSWRWCPSDRPSEPDHVVDLRDREQQEPAVVEETLSRTLTLRGITHLRGARLMLHAACLTRPTTGRGLVLVGASGVGKTTAAIELGRRGFGYVTDETVALDEDCRAMLFRKPLSVVDPRHRRFKTQHAPDALGLTIADHEPTVSAVVLLDRSPDLIVPALEPVSLIDALVDLIPQTSSLVSLSRPLGSLVDLLGDTGGPLRLRYHEIGDAVDLLQHLTDDTERAADLGARVHNSPDGGDVGPSPGSIDEMSPETQVCRGPYLEACEHDGEVLVLVGSTPIRLSGIGATIWLLAERPTPLADLTTGCIAVHGAVDDAATLTWRATEELLAAGVLARAPATSPGP